MTFDEARLMANVNDRAQRLFADGYRARWRNGAVLCVRSPKGGLYRLDTQAETCDCPFFQKHSGRHSCKHLLGWKRLLSRQRVCRLFITVMLLRVWADLDDKARDVPKPQELQPVQEKSAQEKSAQEKSAQETETDDAVS